MTARKKKPETEKNARDIEDIEADDFDNGADDETVYELRFTSMPETQKDEEEGGRAAGETKEDEKQVKPKPEDAKKTANARNGEKLSEREKAARLAMTETVHAVDVELSKEEIEEVREIERRQKRKKEAFAFPDYADARQRELYKMFPADSFLGDKARLSHFIEWVTFFRRNLNRFASDYLGIKLHTYQSILLYLMGICAFIVVIASRADAKSFMIALFACCIAILYPNSQIVLASSTKGQSRLLVSEKIEKELMNMSPVLRSEITKIKDNQSEVIVSFRSKSTITVVPASDNGRGYRSTVLVREESRHIKKSIEDSVLSPFQIIRQVPYMKDEKYMDVPELQEESVDIYITSSFFDNGKHWMWGIADQAYSDMMKGNNSCMIAFDEAIALKHKIKSLKYFRHEMKKQDPLTWKLEFLNLRVKENHSAFFNYGMLEQNQRLKRAFYPRTLIDFKTGKKNPYEIPKQKNEARIIACDMAFVENKANDNSVFTCMRLLPECTTYRKNAEAEVTVDNGYRRLVPYMESVQGGDVTRQAIRIRQLYEDFQADYIVLDTRNAGRDAA